MRDERTHADHVDVERRIEFDVARQVGHGLPRQRAHHARADLVTRPAQRTQAFDAALPAAGRGMELRIERGAGRLDAQQVARRARRAPAGEDLFGLLAQRERHAHPERRETAQDVLDEGRVRLRLDLAALNDQRDVAHRLRLLGAGDNLVRRERVAPHVRVRPANAAVVAVLRADVARLDETAHGDALPAAPELQRVRRGIERGKIAGILQGEQKLQLAGRQRAGRLRRLGEHLRKRHGPGRHSLPASVAYPASAARWRSSA